jgi:hypothetical protein
LSRTIRNSLIMALAVTQQFNDRARRSPAGDNRTTHSINTCDVEGGRGIIFVLRDER